MTPAPSHAPTVHAPESSVGAGKGQLGNVLVATDFSASAELAVQRAVALPVAARSTVSLLHVLSPDAPAPVVHERKAQLAKGYKQARRWQRELRTSDGRQLPGIVPVIASGEASIEIIRQSRQHGVELLVVGRYGEQALRFHQLMGSTAARLVRKAGSSVLMVAQSALSPYQRPLVAIDFSDGSRDALEMALRLVDRGRPLIHVVHAYDIEGEASAQKAMRQQEQLRVKLERFVSDSARVPVDWKLVVGRSDPRRIIAETELACRCDPIVLGRYGRSAAAHILIGSVAEAVARSARCDVVVAHPSRRELGR